jgi:hypothetical protein
LRIDDTKRLVTLVQRLLADERGTPKPSNEQLAMIENIGRTLSVAGATVLRAEVEKAGAQGDARRRQARREALTS